MDTIFFFFTVSNLQNSNYLLNKQTEFENSGKELFKGMLWSSYWEFSWGLEKFKDISQLPSNSIMFVNENSLSLDDHFSIITWWYSLLSRKVHC